MPLSQPTSRFNFTYRYSDDVLSINNQELTGNMYPICIPTDHHFCFLLGFDPVNRDERSTIAHTSLYDKLDDFNFHITNFQFLCGNILSSSAYRVFISQLIRCARACSSYECFILRAMQSSNKLLGMGCVKEGLKSSHMKLFGRYRDLMK